MGDFDIHNFNSVRESILPDAKVALEKLKGAGDWYEYKARGTAEADAVLTPADKANVAADGVLFRVSEETVLSADPNSKQHFFKITDTEIFGIERGTEAAFKEMLENAVIAKDEGHVVPFHEMAANHTFVPIKAELWVAVINHMVLQILKTEPKSKAEGKENDNQTHDVRPAATETPPASLEGRVTKRTNNPLRNTISVVMHLNPETIFHTRGKQRDEQDINKAITGAVVAENRELRREAQGLGGTPADKAARNENPVEKIKDSEGTVEQARAEETPIEKIKDSEGVVEKKLGYDHDHPTDKPQQSR